MHQTTIFDLQSGRMARDAAIARVISNNESVVATLRGIARILAQRRGVVTMDDVRQVANDYGIVPDHPNVFGAVFHARGWEPVGYVQSKIPTNRARVIRTWRYCEEALCDTAS